MDFEFSGFDLLLIVLDLLNEYKIRISVARKQLITIGTVLRFQRLG